MQQPLLIKGVPVAPGVFLAPGESSVSNLYRRAEEIGAIGGEDAFREFWRKRRQVPEDWRGYTFLIPMTNGVWFVRNGGTEWHQTFRVDQCEFDSDCRLLFLRVQLVPQKIASEPSLLRGMVAAPCGAALL
jgi:hypothetical protein